MLETVFSGLEEEVPIQVGIRKNTNTANKAPVPAEIPKKAERAAGLLRITPSSPDSTFVGVGRRQPSKGCDSLISLSLAIGLAGLASEAERIESDALSIVVMPLAPTEKRSRICRKRWVYAISKLCRK